MSGASLRRSVSHVALAVVLALPLWSVATRPDIALVLKVVVAVIVGLTILAPAWGVMLALGVLPLAKGVHLFSGGALTSTAVSELLLLAFAAAALVRLPRGAPDAAEWLRWPAIVLGAAVATSAVVDLATVASVAPDRPFVSDLWSHLTITYWTEEAGNWATVHEALRWLALLVAAVVVERVLRPLSEARRLATWVWIGAATSATTFTLVRVVEIAAARETPVVESLLLLLANARLSVLHPDQNAAGSIFGLLLVAAVVVGFRRRVWWLVGVAAPFFLAGLALAQSRAAIGALVLVALAYPIVRRHRRGARLSPVAIPAALLVGVVGIWMVSSRSHIAASDAIGLRVELAQVGGRMAARYPVWGVGLGDYARTSRRFLAPDQSTTDGFGQFGENAHNNFLQVLVELGAPAGLAFMWLVLPVAAAAWRTPAAAPLPEYEGLALGLSVFLVSALFGHPLLIPEVAGMFFVALGLAAAQVEAPRALAATGRRIALTAAAVYVASLAWRIPF